MIVLDVNLPGPPAIFLGFAQLLATLLVAATPGGYSPDGKSRVGLDVQYRERVKEEQFPVTNPPGHGTPGRGAPFVHPTQAVTHREEAEKGPSAQFTRPARDDSILVGR